MTLSIINDACKLYECLLFLGANYLIWLEKNNTDPLHQPQRHFNQQMDASQRRVRLQKDQFAATSLWSGDCIHHVMFICHVSCYYSTMELKPHSILTQLSLWESGPDNDLTVVLFFCFECLFESQGLFTYTRAHDTV